MNASANKVAQKLRMTSSGFTLIELMVTIAVLAIIAGIAAPSINTQLANQRVKSTTSTIANALKGARNESLIRRQEVELSYNNNGKQAGAIELKGDNSTFATYNYDAKSIINSTSGEIVFRPNKTADVMTFTICDDNKSISPQQIMVSVIGVITTQPGGTC